MACGLPAVGNREASGVEDLIVPDNTGLLTDRSEAATGLAVALSRLMTDAALCERLGQAAKAHVKSWSPARVLGEWEDMLMEIADAQSVKIGRSPRLTRVLP